MRYICLVAVTGALTLGLLAQQTAYAAGNVLMPSDNSSDGTGSLGLVPQEKPPAPQTSSGGSAPANDGQSSNQPGPILPNDMGSMDGGQQTAPPVPAAGGYTPIPPAAQPFAGMATHVIQMPVPTGNPAQGNLAGSLTLTVADKYLWGPFDVMTVNRSLGIPSDQIPAHCHLSVNGNADSDAGTYPFDTGLTHMQAPIGYAGIVKEINVRPMAVCDLVPLPPNAGYVLQTGDKYTVPLGQVTCPPPPRGAQRLVFQYAGNSKGQCAYQ